VYGGVSASFAMLGDVIIAEPGAMIGFAGPRVIEQTVRQKLPEGFQKSEFLLQKGAIDMIVPRAQLRGRICTLIRLFGGSDLSVVPIERPTEADVLNTELMTPPVMTSNPNAPHVVDATVISSTDDVISASDVDIKANSSVEVQVDEHETDEIVVVSTGEVIPATELASDVVQYDESIGEDDESPEVTLQAKKADITPNAAG